MVSIVILAASFFRSTTTIVMGNVNPATLCVLGQHLGITLPVHAESDDAAVGADRARDERDDHPAFLALLKHISEI